MTLACSDPFNYTPEYLDGLTPTQRESLYRVLKAFRDEWKGK